MSKIYNVFNFINSDNRLIPLRNFVSLIGNSRLVTELDKIVVKYFGAGSTKVDCHKLSKVPGMSQELRNLVQDYKYIAYDYANMTT